VYRHKFESLCGLGEQRVFIVAGVQIAVGRKIADEKQTEV
jgi:hypothetical protein